MAEDAYRYSSENYPFNVRPQYQPPLSNDGTLPVLKCQQSNALQAIIFDGSNLAVIKGWEWKSKIELGEFFEPANAYFEAEVLVPVLGDGSTYEWEMYHQYEDTYVTLDYGMLKNIEGKVKFVALFPLYHLTDEDDQTKWFINMRFQGETEWKALGRIFIWSATNDNGIPPIELQNNMGHDVYMKVLIAN